MIFIAAPEVAKTIHGRYVCLLRTGSTESWLVEDSLVELSRKLSDHPLEWTNVERARLEKGAWQS
jgi:putative SOS response-associated peptidase YedK